MDQTHSVTQAQPPEGEAPEQRAAGFAPAAPAPEPCADGGTPPLLISGEGGDAGAETACAPYAAPSGTGAAPGVLGAPPRRAQANQMEPRRRQMSDKFMLYTYKIKLCRRMEPHNWRLCPYAHPGEAGRRRPPHTYTPQMCDFGKTRKECSHGNECLYARNALEYYLHPTRYRTSMCGHGEACTRNICFFAHNEQELRTPFAEPPFGQQHQHGGVPGVPLEAALSQLSLVGGQQAMALPLQHPHQQPQVLLSGSGGSGVMYAAPGQVLVGLPGSAAEGPSSSPPFAAGGMGHAPGPHDGGWVDASGAHTAGLMLQQQPQQQQQQAAGGWWPAGSMPVALHYGHGPAGAGVGGSTHPQYTAASGLAGGGMVGSPQQAAYMPAASMPAQLPIYVNMMAPPQQQQQAAASHATMPQQGGLLGGAPAPAGGSGEAVMVPLGGMLQPQQQQQPYQEQGPDMPLMLAPGWQVVPQGAAHQAVQPQLYTQHGEQQHSAVAYQHQQPPPQQYQQQHGVLQAPLAATPGGPHVPMAQHPPTTAAPPP